MLPLSTIGGQEPEEEVQTKPPKKGGETRKTVGRREWGGSLGHGRLGTIYPEDWPDPRCLHWLFRAGTPRMQPPCHHLPSVGPVTAPLRACRELLGAEPVWAPFRGLDTPVFLPQPLPSLTLPVCSLGAFGIQLNAGLTHSWATSNKCPHLSVPRLAHL